jgi:hypothetical protein
MENSSLHAGGSSDAHRGTPANAEWIHQLTFQWRESQYLAIGFTRRMTQTTGALDVLHKLHFAEDAAEHKMGNHEEYGFDKRVDPKRLLLGLSPHDSPPLVDHPICLVLPVASEAGRLPLDVDD